MKPRLAPVQIPSLGDRLLQSVPALGGAAAFFGTLFGIFTHFVSLESTAPVAWIVVTAAILLSFCAMLCDMLRRTNTELKEAHAQRVELPKILRSLGHANPAAVLLLLVGPSQLLGQGHAVSVYLMRDGFELLVGEGHVQVVQQDTHVQVALTRVASGMEAVLQELVENKPDVLSRTLVRPGQQIQGLM
jgi:hypothetical protein